MAPYRIEFKPSVRKDLKGIPKRDVERILLVVDGLAENPIPTGSRKLASREAWRLWMGRYRVIYTIDDERVTVLVVKVGHSKEAYR